MLIVALFKIKHLGKYCYNQFLQCSSHSQLIGCFHPIANRKGTYQLLNLVNSIRRILAEPVKYLLRCYWFQ